jgi:hypothetical protein
MLTEQLEELLSFVDRGGPIDPVARHRSISRITLRSVLFFRPRGKCALRKAVFAV